MDIVFLLSASLSVISILEFLAVSSLIRSILKVLFSTTRVLSSVSRYGNGRKRPLTFTTIQVLDLDLVLAQPS